MFFVVLVFVVLGIALVSAASASSSAASFLFGRVDGLVLVDIAFDGEFGVFGLFCLFGDLLCEFLHGGFVDFFQRVLCP